ncbi:MAG: glycosyltransferase family 2 protein [Myxococcota bacterium]
MRTIAVVPARNEAPFIASVVRRMPACVARTIVVDDGSEDRTGELAKAAGADVIRHERARGVGAAIAAGYETAWRHGADVAVVLAGDGQMDPADLPRLLRAIDEGADYVKGDRLSWPGVARVMPAHRLAGNVVLSWLTRQATGLHVSDSQCGYTAITRQAAERCNASSMWPRYGYPNDLLCRLALAGCRVVDVPVRPLYGDEVSGVRWPDATVVVPALLIRGAFRRRLAGRR